MVYAFAMAGLLAATLLQLSAQLPHPALWLAITLYGVLFFSARFRYGRIIGAALFGVALLGAWAHWRSDLRLENSLAPAIENNPVEFDATLIDLVQYSERRTRLTARLDRDELEGLAAGTLIQLSDYRPASLRTPYRAGQRVRFSARLKRPHGQLNPGGWDTEAWLWAHGYRATGTIKGGQILAWSGGFGPTLARWREGLATSIKQTLHGRPAAGLIAALVVGDSSAISRKDWSLFAATGITHLVSISGLHITLVAGLVAILVKASLSRLPSGRFTVVPRNVAIVSGLIAAFVYALLAGFSVPTQRTFFMLLVLALSVFWRKKTVLESLAYALTAALLFDPFAVLTVGLWLSFGAVALMAIGVYGRIGDSGWLREWGRAQWAATLGLAPALILAFQTYPWISPIGNAIAIPLVSMVVTPLALIGGLADWGLMLKLAEYLARHLIELLRILAQAGLWEQAAPSTIACGLALCGTTIALLPAGLPGRWLGLIMLLPLLSAAPKPPPPGSWKATVFDVGQGLAVLIETHTRTLMYDTGPDWPGDGDSGNSVIVPGLRALGVRHIDRLLLSHDDNDHTGGAVSVTQSVAVDAVQANLPPRHAMERSLSGTKRMPCISPGYWSWDEVDFRILSPTTGLPADNDNDNDNSCVLQIQGKFASILLPGDIGRHQELRLLETWGGGLKSDVVLAPHHGSRNSSSDAFIETTDPKLVIFSSGYMNRFKHPHPHVLERYGARAQLRTDQHGALLIEGGSEGLRASSLSQQLRRFWRRTP